MKIPLTFLGTSQAIPTSRRNHTSLLLQYKNENILIDCGEGTQRQFRKAKLNPCKITRLLITHWHGDHILGIPGLFQTLALNSYNKTLYIYGPKGTKRFISLLYKLFVFKEKLKIKVEEISIGRFLETKDIYIEALPLQHRTPCNAYCFVEKNKRRLDKKELQKLKLPSSPLLSKLQQGKDIKYKGRTIKADSVSHIEKGKKIAFIFDTALCKSCFEIAKDADLLITEAVYAEKEQNLAKEYKHLTARQAAQIAKKSGSKKLILSHISQRYQNNESIILKEAKKIFKNTTIAEDLDKVEI